MIRTIIIEDEKPAARKLERLLSLFVDLEVVAVVNSVEEGIAYFTENEHPDLIFSDIVLGDGLSFDIFEKVPTKSFIIYTTAFDNYTLKAFKLNSIDYLLKPITEEDLRKAVDKYKSFVPRDKIVYAQTSERAFPTDFTLDELQEVLESEQFFRVNRQFIIHLNSIKNIHTSPYFKVELHHQPNEEITVSRERVKDFKEWIS